MDVAIFSGCLVVGTLIGLTMKKNKVYIVPQALHLTQSKRDYQLQIEKEMEQ